MLDPVACEVEGHHRHGDAVLLSDEAGLAVYRALQDGAAEHLRLICAELQMADVRQQVTLSLLTDFENYTIFKPGDHNAAHLDTLLDQVTAWSTALAPLRTASPAPAT